MSHTPGACACHLLDMPEDGEDVVFCSNCEQSIDACQCDEERRGESVPTPPEEVEA